MPSKKQSRPISHDARLFWMIVAAGFPGVLVSMIMLWTGDYTTKVQWTLTVLIVGVWLGFASAARERIVLPLQTLSNLLAALREGDYSIRVRGGRVGDALGELTMEVNALSATLQEQRLGAQEATALLRTVMAEIDVAIFAFDGEHHLQLVNRAAARLLAQPAEKLIGRSATELGLADCLEGQPARTLQMNFPGEAGRWGMRRTVIRERGMPHHLLVIADLSRVLREEERQAWQRLIRVLGHELNNSLAPIKSMAGSLETLVSREPLAADWKDDMRRGLTVIGARAESLNRFMAAYAQLARLPQPTPRSVDVRTWIRRVTGLETRLAVDLQCGPDLTIQADGDQLEQMLINLVRNAVDAALETGGGVHVGWRSRDHHLEVWVQDEGPGLAGTTNLFVPFFTTKPGGSGIGLVLCRQIAEAHGGSLTLENRRSAQGCEARLRLPL